MWSAGSHPGLGPGDPGTSGAPVGLIQDEHLDAAQVEGRAVVEVIDEPARCGDEDVRRCPKCCFLRLHIQATCKEQSPPGGQPSRYREDSLPGRPEPCHPPGLTAGAEQKAENKAHGGPTCMDFIVHWERWVI